MDSEKKLKFQMLRFNWVVVYRQWSVQNFSAHFDELWQSYLTILVTTLYSFLLLFSQSQLLLLLSCFSRVRLVQHHRRQPTRLPLSWDSPGKNTGVGCHFLLQCMKVESESEVAQSCPTLPDPMDCSPPGSSVHGIFQARVLEWGAIEKLNALP